MKILRRIALAKLESFLKDEWPHSATYFGVMAVGNSHFFPKFKGGLDVGIGTADRALDFIESYRLNPERTMESARAELATRRSGKRKKAVRPPRRLSEPRRDRAVA